LLAVGVLQNFPDINFNQTGISTQYTPPDTMMAVGPTTVVGAVNTAIVLKDKGGTTLAGPTQFSTFFRSILRRGDGFSDPYVLYDDQAQRYYVGILEYPSSATTGYFDFAVSNSSTPTGLNIGSGTGDWKVFSQITSVNEGGTQFPDFPKMGWNNDAVFVSFNQFQGGAFFSHDLVLAISKSSIQAGGPLSTFQTDVSTGYDINILIPARMHNETVGNLEYFVQATGGGASSTTVNVVKETGYNAGPGSFSTTPITVNAYTNSPGVPGLTSQIDDRMLSADWVNNKLVAAQDVGVGGLNLARWYEFDTSATTPALVSGQQGDISAGPGVSTSYPSVAVNPSGDIGMTYIQSSSIQPYSMYVTGRLASDTPGAMQPGLKTAAGASPVPSALRGGDYSATEYDPVNTGQFWSANEYNLDSSGSNFHWGTQIANYTLGPPPSTADLSVTNTGPTSPVPAGTQATYTITLTNIGPNSALNLVLTDILPAGSTLVSMTPATGNPDSFTFAQSGGTITETAASVPAGNSDTFSLVVFAPGNLPNGANFSDTASVSSNGADPTPSDNTATVTGSIVNNTASADLAVTASGPATSNNEGDNIVFYLSVINKGPTDATGTVLTDTLGANLKYFSATSSQGTISVSGGVVTFSFGTVTYGQTVTATVTAQSTEDGNVTDNASVTSNLPNLSNNIASATTFVNEGKIVVSAPITTKSKSLNNFGVATFTHASGVEPTSAFSATINWGDGTTSPGAITESGTTYQVVGVGSHNYSKGGSHTITTTVVEFGSSPNIEAPFVIIIDSGDEAESLSGSLNTSSANPGDQAFAAPIDSGEQGLDLQGNETTASGKRKLSST
jgi:uncharacterized repeat protein (TIGR01451 family)